LVGRVCPQRAAEPPNATRPRRRGEDTAPYRRLVHQAFSPPLDFRLFSSCIGQKNEVRKISTQVIPIFLPLFG
jgi:hypothetical protein